VNSPRDWRDSTRRRVPAPRSVSSILYALNTCILDRAASNGFRDTPPGRIESLVAAFNGVFVKQGSGHTWLESLIATTSVVALRQSEMQPMIASDATAQRAPPCHLDHPQLQPAGRAVRLRDRSPTSPTAISWTEEPAFTCADFLEVDAV
jgi:hypothetical protein